MKWVHRLANGGNSTDVAPQISINLFAMKMNGIENCYDFFFFRFAFVLFVVEQNCNRTRCISDVNVMQSWLSDQPRPSSMKRRPPANMIEIKFNATLASKKQQHTFLWESERTSKNKRHSSVYRVCQISIVILIRFTIFCNKQILNNRNYWGDS